MKKLPGKILLLSAYDAISHKKWRCNLVAMFPQIEWVQLILPPRHFNWRVRGNSLSWAFDARHILKQHYDLILVTSMVDLSSLRGFIPELASHPTLCYFHENQFAYPASDQQYSSIEPQITSLYCALCADLCVFNSNYNKQTFLAGVEKFLAKMPDHVPDGLVARLETSEIVPVPISDDYFLDQIENNNPLSGRHSIHHANAPLTIVWNHRREYDKGPALLLEIVQQLNQSGSNFCLHLLGQQFRRCPVEFEQIMVLLNADNAISGTRSAITHFIDNELEYQHLLSCSDVVLSTALHDFQGLSLIEAAALGCTPLAPERLVYPEYLRSEFLYNVGTNVREEANHAVTRLLELANMKQAGEDLPSITMEKFSQAALESKYLEMFDLCMKSFHTK